MSLLRMTTGRMSLFNFALMVISVRDLFMKLTHLPLHQALCEWPQDAIVAWDREYFTGSLAWMRAADLKSNSHWHSRPHVPNSLETLS